MTTKCGNFNLFVYDLKLKYSTGGYTTLKIVLVNVIYIYKKLVNKICFVLSI